MPERATARRPHQGDRRRHHFADTHSRTETITSRTRCRTAGGEVVGGVRTAASACSADRQGGYAEYRWAPARPRFRCPTGLRTARHWRCSSRASRYHLPHRCARCSRARSWWCTRGRRRRLARRAAREARGRARDRHGVVRGEARIGFEARPMLRSDPSPRAVQAAARGKPRPQVDVVLEMAGGETSASRSRRSGLRPARGLRERSRELASLSNADISTLGSVIGLLAVDCMSDPQSSPSRWPRCSPRGDGRLEPIVGGTLPARRTRPGPPRPRGRKPRAVVLDPVAS